MVCYFVMPLHKVSILWQHDHASSLVKSVGQNVSIVLTKPTCNRKVMKLFEPNETINMIGVRIEVNNVGLRIYTAHLEQPSINPKDVIVNQFDEIVNQFRSADMGMEPMLMIFDANVHVGSNAIKDCKDHQDWGGKMLMDILNREGIILLNNADLCKGIVTRVDPRNGHQSTLDLALCNILMLDKVKGMQIDEDGTHKLKRYGKKTCETDHNSICIQLEVSLADTQQEHGPSKKIFNLRNLNERNKLEKFINKGSLFDSLFTDTCRDINDDVKELESKWNFAMSQCFHEVKPSKKRIKGVDEELRSLLDKEKWIRAHVLTNPERGLQISAVDTCQNCFKH